VFTGFGWKVIAAQMAAKPLSNRSDARSRWKAAAGALPTAADAHVLKRRPTSLAPRRYTVRHTNSPAGSSTSHQRLFVCFTIR
jgi:hypothetical protein